MTVSSDINSLINRNTDPYTASASVGAGALDTSSSTVTGDREGGLFAAQKNLGKDDFLKLLVAQLQFQDPLSPMENTDFIAQLAQFSSLEGTYNIEKAIGKLDDSFQGSVSSQQFSAQSMTNASAVSLIGKEVCLRRSSFTYAALGSQTVPIRVHLGDANQGTVQIIDNDGNVVRTLDAKDKDAENSVNLAWDGVSDSGERAATGTYTINVVGQESNPALYSFVQDVVEGVRFTAAGPLVKIGGQELSIGDIMSVSIGESSGDPGSALTSTAVGLLGKDVRYQEEYVKYGRNDGETVTTSLDLGGVQRATVELVDANGKVVRTWTVAGSADGKVTVTSKGIPDMDAGRDGVAQIRWDGTVEEGQDYAKAGVYRFRVAGSTRNPSQYFFSEGRVEAVNTVAGSTELRVSGRTVPMSAIVGIAVSMEEGA